MSAEFQYWLPAHVTACATSRGTVLLDLKRNRYQGIGVADSLALAPIVGNWPEPGTFKDIRTSPTKVGYAKRYATVLVKSGLLCTSKPSQGFLPRQHHMPSTTMGGDVEGRSLVRPHHWMMFTWAYLWALYSIRFRTFEHIAHSIVKMRVAGSRKATPLRDSQAANLVAIFRTLRPHALSSRGRCLLHSIALLKFLSYYQVFPNWCIGVMLNPWAAHSWVQQGMFVLDSTPEDVDQFAPILVV